jgi:hypothetical protein
MSVGEEHLKWMKLWGQEGIILRKKMAEIARPAVLRLPPFDSLQLESCLEPYRKYLDEKTTEQQALLVNAFIRFMEFIIGGDVCRDKHAMEVWSEIDDEYQRNFTSSYVPPPPRRMPEIKNSDAKKIIFEQFKHMWPEFTRVKSNASSVIRLVKPNVHVEGISIEFDFGTFGPGHFTVYIGTVKPEFGAELSAIMCMRKRQWDFHNAEQCVVAVENVIGLAKLLMPIFEDKIIAMKDEANNT